MFKHLSRVKIEFNPLDPRSCSALEFLAQCNSRKARASNPDCEVVVKRRTDSHHPQVTITFINGKEEVLDGSKLPAQVMRKRIFEQAEFMETEQLFKDSGLDLSGHHPSTEGLFKSKTGSYIDIRRHHTSLQALRWLWPRQETPSLVSVTD